MGRGKGTRSRGRGGGRGGGRRAPKKDDSYRTDTLDKESMRNELFSNYYKSQNIVPEDEWDAFTESLTEPLPTTFRIAGNRQTAQELNDTIKNTYVPNLRDLTFEDQPVQAPAQIPWYPEGLAWQFNVAKKVLRKMPDFRTFHSFLVFETEVGNVSRQEAVSMLPPFFLEVEPHHIVMDMCAAPGSKTAQLLEALHAQDTPTASSIPKGLLIANDSDHKRTHLLIHQSARLPSPALMVTNLDASIYPILKVPIGTNAALGTLSATPALKGQKLEQLLFDRILCDVPCSGDGTLRKNVGIWKTWRPVDGNGLHGLQLRILQRAMKMLKPGGRIVYSTCSLNPVENEAVIAAALNWNSEYHLIDISDKLPALVRRPGLSTWSPAVAINTDKVTTMSSYEEFTANRPAAESTNNKVTAGHFPPTNAESLNLGRCIRIYPHLQDTGGFFVAALERKMPTRTTAVRNNEPTSVQTKKREAEEESAEVPESKKVKLEETAASPAPVSLEKNTAPSPVPTTAEDGAGTAAVSGGTFHENPYTFLSPTDPVLLSCIERLALTNNFPAQNVLVRNPTGDAARALYLGTDIVRTVIENNDYNKIRLTSAGTKVFQKQEPGKGSGDAQFRILGEGLNVVMPYVNPETIISANIDDLKTLMKGYYPLCTSFLDPFKTAIEQRPSGCHVVRFKPSATPTDSTLTRDLLLPIWKSNVSITLMIDKRAKSAMSMRLFGADITTAGRDAAELKKTNAAPTLDVDVKGDVNAVEAEVDALLTEDEAVKLEADAEMAEVDLQVKFESGTEE